METKRASVPQGKKIAFDVPDAVDEEGTTSSLAIEKSRSSADRDAASARRKSFARGHTLGPPARDAADLYSLPTSAAISAETPKAALTFMDDRVGALDSTGTGMEELEDSESADVLNAGNEDGRGPGSAAKRFGRRAVVKPDNSVVHLQYNQRESMFDFMQFGADENQANWESLANRFVLQRDNRNLNDFVERVMTAKVQAERKMRRQLDMRVLRMRVEKLNSIFSKEGANKLRNHVRLYQDGDRLLQVLQEKEETKRAAKESLSPQRKSPNQDLPQSQGQPTTTGFNQVS